MLAAAFFTARFDNFVFELLFLRRSVILQVIGFVLGVPEGVLLLNANIVGEVNSLINVGLVA